MSPLSKIPLGWRLALVASAATAVVLGTILLRDAERQRRAVDALRVELLEKSLAPLAFRLRSASRETSVGEVVSEFHRAYVDSGYPEHHLRIEDSEGRALWAVSGVDLARPDADFVRATVNVRSPVFPTGNGRILAWEERGSVDRLHALTRRAFRAHFLGSLVTVVLVVQIVSYLFVTRPLAELVLALGRMERGYWDEVEVPHGAPEIRWLAERFGKLGVELRKTVQQLVEAERRAAISRPPPFDTQGRPSDRIDETAADSPSSGALRDYWRSLQAELEVADPHDPSTLALARDVWERRRDELELLADWQLKGEIERAALRVLEPVELGRLEDELARIEHDLEAWIDDRRREVELELGRAGLPVVSCRTRVKQVASVWRKMRGKGLRLDQIHDLVALRVIVPTEEDCYAVLRVVHGRFQPEYGRFNDFVAHPKRNGYQSLHTCVRADDGRVFEVQVRSVSMHRVAESGSAAHWIYKASTTMDVGRGRRRAAERIFGRLGAKDREGRRDRA